MLHRLTTQYWFFTVACCDCQPMTMDLSMSLTNGDSNLNKEFSADENMILTIVIAELGITMIILLIQLHSDSLIKGNVPSRQMFKLAIALSMVSQFCYLNHYVYGARFSAGSRTRGCRWFPPLLA